MLHEEERVSSMFAILGSCVLSLFGFFFLLCLFAEGIGFELLGMIFVGVCICGVLSLFGTLLVGVLPVFMFMSEMLKQMSVGEKRRTVEIGAVVVSILLGICCCTPWIPAVVVLVVAVVELYKNRKKE